ncbi:MAG: formylmethanofuran dehydrogenase subunit C [Candidatus Altiarchaeota archaeon]|nr:formylmethanofuran dehydrogenase subunit C [Candidatus Altiarchaeota archaeon]
MKEIRLKPKAIPGIGMEAENISPDMFAEKSLKEIRALDVFVGNKKKKLGEYFTVGGEASEKPEDLRIVIRGDASKVKRIGERMSAGEVIIEGDAGMHLGSRMSGGEIRVSGSVGSWAGMEMSGGRITIEGDAGNFFGAAYRGRGCGMTEGEIEIKGNAGHNLGGNMGAGRITVGGDSGEFAGVGMKGGVLIISGNAGLRVGAGMIDGIIIVEGGIKEMLPSFKERGRVDGVKGLSGAFIGYEGDLAECGRGRLYVRD